MIQMGSRMGVADNSGAMIAMCIKTLGGTGKRNAGLGDIIKVSIKKAVPHSKVKPGSVWYAVIVRVKNHFRRKKDNTTISFSSNAVVLIDKANDPIGTRVFGPMPRELRAKFPKIISLAPEVL